MYVCFIDFEKAFDRVNWTKMMEILKKLVVDWRDRRMISNLYLEMSATVRIGSDCSQQGLRRACWEEGCVRVAVYLPYYLQCMQR